MAAGNVVADTGPLIALARIERIQLLASVFDEVLIPPAVFTETCRDVSLPGAGTIRAAVEQSLLRIVVPPAGSSWNFPPALGPGERAAIELAAAMGTLVMMDDRPGRRAAQRRGVPVVGTGGVLLRAKKLGAIDQIKPLVWELRSQDYRLSEALVEDLLRRAGEQ